MNTLSLDTIRDCLDGAVPGAIATCASDGTPNVSFISQVDYVDREHVALSYQFFNKTRQNILQTPFAAIEVIDPHNGAMYVLHAQYLRTEAQGPLFERMKVKLAGIASHEGMSSVFQLQGSDIYRVLAILQLLGSQEAGARITRNRLSALRLAGESIQACQSLESLLDRTLDALHTHFGVQHAMILLLDAAAQRLYTVASRGYDASGVGAEIMVGNGVIGVAAQTHKPIRIGYFAAEYAYRRAIREIAAQSEHAAMLGAEIPFAGLREPHSQMAVPIVSGKELLGVLYMESVEDMHFGYDDEDALVMFAMQVGANMKALQMQADSIEEPAVRARTHAPRGEPLVVRHFVENDSVFIGDTYLIKGVAGAIFWALVNDVVHSHRTEFTNRELRLDPRIRLPDISENLEARLILLERRLAEHKAGVQLLKTGRGRFRLQVERPLELIDVPASR